VAASGFLDPARRVACKQRGPGDTGFVSLCNCTSSVSGRENGFLRPAIQCTARQAGQHAAREGHRFNMILGHEERVVLNLQGNFHRDIEDTRIFPLLS
jgi:hypothetical protein